LAATGDLVVIGGLGNNLDTIGSFEIYNATTDTWSLYNYTELGTGIAFHSSVVLADGRILITGGINDSGIPQSSVFIIDPATPDLYPMTSMNHRRAGHSSVLITSGTNAGRILVSGGYDENGNVLNTAEIYNPASDTWTFTRPMKSPCYGHTSIYYDEI